MDRKRSRLIFVGVLCLVLVMTFGLLGGAADAKKKKKKKKSTPVTASVTKTVNGAVPDALAAAPNTWGKLSTPLEVTGAQFNKKFVGNVDVTFQTTGAVALAADDLFFKLTAPNGRAIYLAPDNGALGPGTQSIGPLTLTPNSGVGVCNAVMPPCPDPDQSLNRPFAGTAGDSTLALFNGIKMAGTWTFTVFDSVNTKTSTLNAVTLKINSAKPVK